MEPRSSSQSTLSSLPAPAMFPPTGRTSATPTLRAQPRASPASSHEHAPEPASRSSAANCERKEAEPRQDQAELLESLRSVLGSVPAPGPGQVTLLQQAAGHRPASSAHPPRKVQRVAAPQQPAAPLPDEDGFDQDDEVAPATR